MRDKNMPKLTLDEVEKLAFNILLKHGFTQEHAAALVNTMLSGERDGCTSHGIYRLLGCIHTLKAGKVDPRAIPEVTDTAPGVVTVNAAGGFSQLAFEQGLPWLCRKAVTNGIALLAINNCVHFSALWVEIEQLTQQGLVVIACNPSHAWVAPHGSKEPVLGTNPFAFGWPRKEQHPYVFDFATSAIARGDIELHHLREESLPDGCAINRHGEMTNSPEEAMEGAMLTFGGHKGSALSTMIELLAGPLIGDLMSYESLAHDNGAKASPFHGELIIAIYPDTLLGDKSETNMARAEELFKKLKAHGGRLPSERRYSAREKSMREGVEISQRVYDELQMLLSQ
jgi:delta1-piperideine-2-carboxylate reductase